MIEMRRVCGRYEGIMLSIRWQKLTVLKVEHCEVSRSIILPNLSFSLRKTLFKQVMFRLRFLPIQTLYLIYKLSRYTSQTKLKLILICFLFVDLTLEEKERKMSLGLMFVRKFFVYHCKLICSPDDILLQFQITRFPALPSAYAALTFSLQFCYTVH